MKEEWAVGTILVAGIVISLILRTYLGVAVAALGIPAYLSYRSRERNLLAKSRLYDRDLFIITGVAIVTILLFDYIWDPRVGLISLAILVPLLAVYADRLKGGKNPQKTR